ncbi:hypothetical protein FNF29_05912 [Cafeteria roenbergensis]|uniref:Protein kinase domain-containing protein n=1 Tax=Cafeteria roenbergensis TaxID=33653 RepID=A0A5A8C8T7_CAFRO|nr:hypothetical protein FNF29_05912 [Cafeteria roenbergensis]|eukprot:KAA0149526.1 hypothetical protein FNF29_05912 [Cafeteria roenbergensis]
MGLCASKEAPPGSGASGEVEIASALHSANKPAPGPAPAGAAAPPQATGAAAPPRSASIAAKAEPAAASAAGGTKEKGKGKPRKYKPNPEDVVHPTMSCGRHAHRDKPGSCLAAYAFDLTDEASVLGEGASGKVVVGKDRKTGKEVAIKVMVKRKLQDEDIAAVSVEVDAMQRTKGHPHVVELFAFFDEPDAFYLAIELVRGGELFTQLASGDAYTEVEARNAMHQAVAAIEWCHRNGVVHRDLKPENILLTEAKRSAAVKVADFGFAKTIRPGSHPLTTPCGTPGYVAPEILKSAGTYGYGLSSDVWSLGVLLFILLSGEPPFYLPTTSMKTGKKLKDEREREAEMFRRIRHGVYHMDNAVWTEVTPEARSLVTSMLTVDPDERPTLMQVQRHPWWTAKLEGSAPLRGAQKHLRVTNGRRKLKRAFNAALVTARLRLALGSFSSKKSEGDDEDGGGAISLVDRLKAAAARDAASGPAASAAST